MTRPFLDLVVKVAAATNASRPQPIDVARGGDAPLFGPGGVLDSMALVHFIIEVETALADETGATIVLANERAMSQRRSPFLTLGALADYIAELMQEAKG